VELPRRRPRRGLPADVSRADAGVFDIVVCWKWVALEDDARWAGVSLADRAALETALRMADASTASVTVVSVGPAAAAASLREALAVGASRAVLVTTPSDLRSDVVAAELAEICVEARWVLCGDHSIDRGSGSVPALVAAELGAAQALGLVHVDTAHPDEPVRVVRRLDGGRREDLLVDGPAVLSVEGAVAVLRRASLPAELASRTATIDVRHGPSEPCDAPAAIGPFRPRPRVLPAPDGLTALERVKELTDTGESGHGELVTLEPRDAARRIVTALREWGYLAPSGRDGSDLGDVEDLAGRSR
jgi:electron transfer flavoprotein beta subunit